MTCFSQPPGYEQVANAYHSPEETSSPSSNSTKAHENDDTRKEGSKDNYVLLDTKEVKFSQSRRWRYLLNGNGWLWEILAMYVLMGSRSRTTLLTTFLF
jgi:hypothetical protein